jgi:hypothetical protein
LTAREPATEVEKTIFTNKTRISFLGGFPFFLDARSEHPQPTGVELRFEEGE